MIKHTSRTVRQHMKEAYAIIGICLAILTLNIACKVSSTKFETEFDKGVAQANPEYYEGFKKILVDFQNHLVDQKIIENNDNKNYIRLLKEIRDENKKDFDITYPLSDSLRGLVKLLKNDGLITGTNGFPIAIDSKESLFQEKLSEFFRYKKEIDPSIVANIMLEVYDADDFDFPFIKVKLFKFIDPNSDLILYSYIGKPITE